MTFLPLDLTNPDSIENVLSHIDYTMQYGEDEEPKEVGATRAAPVFPRTQPRGKTGVDSVCFLHRMRREADYAFIFPYNLFL